MALITDPNTGLPYNYAIGDSGWGVNSYNKLIEFLGATHNLAVEDRTHAAPPAGVHGARYIVQATATGAWTGHEDDVAYYNGTAWKFFTPADGWSGWDKDTVTRIIFSAGAWIDG